MVDCHCRVGSRILASGDGRGRISSMMALGEMGNESVHKVAD